MKVLSALLIVNVAAECVLSNDKSELSHVCNPELNMPTTNYQVVQCEEFDAAVVPTGPVWVAERFDKGASNALYDRRSCHFREETVSGLYKPTVRSLMYSVPGMSRGHLAAAGFHGSNPNETFILNLNVLPQNEDLNVGNWFRLEHAVFRLSSIGQVYVLSGALYLGKPTYLPDDVVRIPSHFYKVVRLETETQNYCSVFVLSNESENSLPSLTTYRDLPSDITLRHRTNAGLVQGGGINLSSYIRGSLEIPDSLLDDSREPSFFTARRQKSQTLIKSATNFEQLDTVAEQAVRHGDFGELEKDLKDKFYKLGTFGNFENFVDNLKKQFGTMIHHQRQEYLRKAYLSQIRSIRQHSPTGVWEHSDRSVSPINFGIAPPTAQKRSTSHAVESSAQNEESTGKRSRAELKIP